MRSLGKPMADGAGLFRPIHLGVRRCRDGAVRDRPRAYDDWIQRGPYEGLAVQGQFMVFDGFIEMDPEAKIVKTIEATIKTWSINTNHHKRDAHLRSPDFLDVDRYPTMTYKLKNYQATGEQHTAVGDLTLHGVTKPVTLVGHLIGVVKDPTAILVPDLLQKERSIVGIITSILMASWIMAA